VQIMVYSSSTNPRSRPDMLAAGADDYVINRPPATTARRPAPSADRMTSP
jgi:hypothetical protein